NGARLSGSNRSTKTCTTPDRALRANPFGVSVVCVVDQYGNRYSFTIDSVHTYVYGTMTSAQGCQAPTWPLLGSYVQKNGIQLELTVANPAGNGDPNCIDAYKLKGTYPNSDWYYS